MMSSPWIFICPSSRGIGLALTRHLLARTPPSIPILATTRHPSPAAAKAELLGLKGEQHEGKGKSTSADQLARRLTLVRCDVTDESSIEAAAREAQRLFPPQTHHLHLAAAIPGVLLNPEKSPLQIDAHAALRSFQVNTVGPLLLAKHFFEFLPRRATDMQEAPASDDENVAVPGPESEAQSSEGVDPHDSFSGEAVKLPRHATWLSMAARVGSTTDNHSGGWFSYRASKAGVTSLTRSLDVMLQARAGGNALAMAYHPGTVKTDLSRDFWGSVPDEKLLTPEFAAARMLDVVCGLEMGQRGRCWGWDKKEVPP